MGLLDGLFDKEGMVSNTIENCLEDIANELGCRPTELFIMIKPTTDDFSEEGKIFKNWIYQTKDGKTALVREISLKEILGD
jgi:hypothetical protein